MSAKRSVDRRGFLAPGLAIAGASLLGGCGSELSDQPWVKRILDSAEALTRVSQRVLISPTALVINVSTQPRPIKVALSDIHKRRSS